MDSLTATINELRITLCSAIALAEKVEQIAAAVPVAAPIAKVRCFSCGWNGVKTSNCSCDELNARIAKQQAHSVAAPALQRQNAVINTSTVGPVPAIAPKPTSFPEDLAKKYLGEADIYLPSKTLEAEADKLLALAENTNEAYSSAPKGKKRALRAANSNAWFKYNKMKFKVVDAHYQARRFDDYYRGTFATSSECNAGSDVHYYIYHFYVFEVPCFINHEDINTWKPIGMLNPHAYTHSKLSGAKKSFLEFTDKTVAPPVLPTNLFLF